MRIWRNDMKEGIIPILLILGILGVIVYATYCITNIRLYGLEKCARNPICVQTINR